MSQTDPTEAGAAPEAKESPAEFARRSLPANLLAAAVCGVLTLWMGESMPNWPRPTKEPGQPEEVAGLVRYLMSDEARYFVGSFIVMDGGTDAALRSDDWPTSTTDK